MNRFAVISAGFFFFLETDELILKCKTKELAKIIFKKNTFGELTLPDFKFYYKQSVIDP